MSTRIGRALADLERDTSSLRLAPPAQIRNRGEAWRRRRVAGRTAVAAAAAVGATMFGIAAIGGGNASSPPLPVRSGSVSRPGSVAAGEADCGTHVLHQGERLPDAALTCFLDAVAGKHRARLAVTRPTTEGDPIHFLYVADGTGAVQLTTDAREDSFGPRDVTRQLCTGPFADHGYIAFAQCSSPAPA
jgi:hypothetical protein